MQRSQEQMYEWMFQIRYFFFFYQVLCLTNNFTPISIKCTTHPNTLQYLKNPLSNTYSNTKLSELPISSGVNCKNRNIDILTYTFFPMSMLSCSYYQIYQLEDLHYGGGFDKMIEFLSFLMKVLTNIFFFCYFTIMEKQSGSFFFYRRRRLFIAYFYYIVTILCSMYFLVRGFRKRKLDICTLLSSSSGVSKNEFNIL